MSHKPHTLKVPQALEDWATAPQETSLWGQPSTVKPAMVPTVFGDGGQLFGFQSVMTRPNYYVLLGHSTWTSEDIGDHSEAIMQNIEAAFGNADDERDDEDGEEDEDSARFPAWRDGGASWWVFEKIPESVWAATQEDLQRQMREQQAIFLGEHRVIPGMLLEHAEFGVVQARFSDELGWHYVPPNTWHLASVESVGWARDFTAVAPHLKNGEPAFDGSGLHRTISTPQSALAAEPTGKRKQRPR